jgi:trans-aconitate methyltransferase
MLDLPSTDERPIWDIWLSAYWLPSVTVAGELSIFEALAEEPTTAAGLAERLGLNLRGVEVLLGMLASLDLLVRHGGLFRLTPVAHQFLLRESPHHWGGVFDLAAQSNPLHATLRKAVSATGPEATPPWAKGELGPAQARRVARFMNSHSFAAALGMARCAEFASIKSLLDVGGGSGCFSIALAQRHPQLRCTVLDLPAMCDVALEYVRAAGADDRVGAHAADMMKSAWPPGHDAVLMSNILHDWGFETCARLVAKAFEALPSGGRLFLHEMLLDDGHDGPRTTAAFSVLMLIGTEGRQLTFAELRDLLQGAGFADADVVGTHAYYSLVSARKP